jgi:predicted component of type VI protein secretion system
MFAAFTVGAAAAIASCQNAQPTGPSNGSTSAPAAPAATANIAQPPAEKPTTPAPAQQWKMPNLVGSNLQQAQDQIQALTGNAIFITTSHDATGKHRNQVLDSNWKVCSQNVSAGTPIAAGTEIDFGAVKLAELCP